MASSFLSAVADRLGIWTKLGSSEVAWGNMNSFLAYTQMLLWYLPSSVANIAGWAATIFEIAIAAALLLGVAIRPTAIASGALLLVFAISMTISTGVEGPLSFSVWTAAAASLLLAAIDPQSTGPRIWTA
ncbi:hypothetical protein DSM3645_07296 [Blastopirellula marina DSM 3645]|uniref:DoxX family protein n=1 Tax=Blastopirellula marina DSM 3645 TaxID=314230 RepID=A3ZYK2_9BACT|nr:hypothetical protein DSM3645_07296 [Blastopirellula marina DSM 3645]